MLAADVAEAAFDVVPDEMVAKLRSAFSASAVQSGPSGEDENRKPVGSSTARAAT
jgi:hypothetical protein